MSAAVWKSGPPPAIGWWPASVHEDPSTWRWWNGLWWSTASCEGNSLDEVAARAKHPADYGPFQDAICWTDWPENMRDMPHYPLWEVKPDVAASMTHFGISVPTREQMLESEHVKAYVERKFHEKRVPGMSPAFEAPYGETPMRHAFSTPAGAFAEELREQVLKDFSVMLDSEQAPTETPKKVTSYPPCKGLNCKRQQTGEHSLECHAQHAATIAGGVFVPGTIKPEESTPCQEPMIVLLMTSKVK